MTSKHGARDDETRAGIDGRFTEIATWCLNPVSVGVNDCCGGLRSRRLYQALPCVAIFSWHDFLGLDVYLVLF